MTKRKQLQPQPAASPSNETYGLPPIVPTDLAAAAFSVSVPTLRRYHRKGLLPAVRAQVGARGGRLLFRRGDLLRLFGLSTTEAT